MYKNDTAFWGSLNLFHKFISKMLKKSKIASKKTLMNLYVELNEKFIFSVKIFSLQVPWHFQNHKVRYGLLFITFSILLWKYVQTLQTGSCLHIPKSSAFLTTSSGWWKCDSSYHVSRSTFKATLNYKFNANFRL